MGDHREAVQLLSKGILQEQGLTDVLKLQKDSKLLRFSSAHSCEIKRGTAAGAHTDWGVALQAGFDINLARQLDPSDSDSEVKFIHFANFQ